MNEIDNPDVMEAIPLVPPPSHKTAAALGVVDRGRGDRPGDDHATCLAAAKIGV